MQQTRHVRRGRPRQSIDTSFVRAYGDEWLTLAPKPWHDSWEKCPLLAPLTSPKKNEHAKQLARTRDTPSFQIHFDRNLQQQATIFCDSKVVVNWAIGNRKIKEVGYANLFSRISDLTRLSICGHAQLRTATKLRDWFVHFV